MLEFFTTVVDCNIPLEALRDRAVIVNNVILVDQRITDANFPRQVVGVWTTELGIMPMLPSETYEEAAARIDAEGLIVKNLRSLLAFMEQHPVVAESYESVVAPGYHSRIALDSGLMHVPSGKISEEGKRRTLSLRDFSTLKYGPIAGGILVSGPRMLQGPPTPEETQRGLRLL